MEKIINKMKAINLTWLNVIAAILIISSGCEKSVENLTPVPEETVTSHQLKATNISITNPGFESNFSGWTDLDPSSISTSDVNSGSKAAKITGAGGKFSQEVAVSANTDYTLSAYVLDSWRIGVYINGTKKSRSGNASDWKQETVTFNSGSATTITIFGEYKDGEGRFDDFSLIGSTGVIDETEQLTVSSVSASANDGNVPENTIDGSLSTRWSANGNGQWIKYELGAKKTVSSVNIAWYKGADRSSIFKIFVGSTEVYSGTSSGSTTQLEEYTFTETTGNTITIYGHGNTSNSWNSITEVEIYGTTNGGGTGDDTTPPAEVSNLAASAGDGQVTLSWINPTDVDFVSTTITASPGTYTTTLTGNSKIISGLTNGTTYTFILKTQDESGNVSTGTIITATPESNGGGGTASIPSDLMNNCNQWKITYPDGSEDKTLCGEPNNEYWFVNDSKDAMVFRVPIRSNNGSTPNSSYIRSELRERTEDGSSDIYWTTTGTHVAYVKQAITHLPIVKDHLVATQIHGNKSDGIDDAMVLRLEGSHLFLSFNGGKLREDLTIKTNYALGTVHEVIFEVVNGKHYCYYSEDGNLGNAYLNGNASSYLVKDGSRSYVMDLNYDQSYFKIGNYTQSNPDKEGSYTDDPNNYGEVAVYDFWVQHQ